MFEDAARISADAAVALYAFGDPDLLRAATAELFAVLDTWIAPRSWAGLRVLDLGCGTGRVAEVLAAAGAVVAGADVSPTLLAVARSRLVALHTCSLVRIAGSDLAMFADTAFDLVVAADVMPYVADPIRMLGEIGRVLRPGGICALFNLAYDREVDAAELAAMARSAQLDLVADAPPLLRFWDAKPWRLDRACKASRAFTDS